MTANPQYTRAGDRPDTQTENDKQNDDTTSRGPAGEIQTGNPGQGGNPEPQRTPEIAKENRPGRPQREDDTQ